MLCPERDALHYLVKDRKHSNKDMGGMGRSWGRSWVVNEIIVVRQLFLKLGSERNSGIGT